MTLTTEQITQNNLTLIEKKDGLIQINIDHEEKRLLIFETKSLYRKSSNLSENDLVEIIVNGSAVINQMIKLKNCS